MQKEHFSVKLIYCIVLVLKRHFFNRNVDPIIFGIWNGKNSLFITQGTLQFPCASQFFPIHGLAVVVKKKSIIRGFAARGGFFFTTPAKPFMGKNYDLHGNCNVPFVIHREFSIPPFAASRLMEELSRSKFQKWLDQYI